MVRILQVLEKEMPTSTLRQVASLTSGLASSGHQISICSVESNSQHQSRAKFYLEGSELTFCPQSLRWDPTFVRRLGRTIHRLQPEVIHFWGSTTNGPVWLANQFHGNRPIVATLLEPAGPTSFRADVVQRWLATRTRYVVEHPLDSLPLAEMSGQQATTIRCGLPNTERTSLKCNPDSNLHSTLGIESNIKVVVAKTDLIKRSRCQDLIWALEQLRVLHEDVHLVIIGEGEHEAELRQYAERAMSHDGVVHFIRPTQGCDRERLSQCVCLWHAGELPEADSILQAMSCGLPVIVTDSPAGRDLVQDDQTGFVVPSGDAAEFARKANFLLTDESLHERLGSAGRKRVEADFSIERMVGEYVSVYESARAAKKAA